MWKVFGPAMVLAVCSSVASAQQQAPCSTVAECAQKAMEAGFQAKKAVELAVPKGAVMAFNLQACPEGWSRFGALAGRVVVGAGTAGGLSDRKLGQSGGAETHTLSVAEMPSHSHSYTFTDHHNTPRHTDFSPHEFGNSNRGANTSASGGGAPHNIMQPYHVLLYCEKK